MAKVIVLGGGSAGWLTALFVKKNWPETDITVVEDLSIPPIIAGESSTVPFIELLEYLNIDFNKWIKEVDALPKLGGKFVGWNTHFSSFVQPLFSRYLNRYNFQFPEFGTSNDLLSSLMVLGLPLDKITVAGHLIEQQKVPFVNNNLESVCRPMYHFDSRKNADFFRNLGLDSITSLNAKVVSATLTDSGDVTQLILSDNQIIEGDWFFDCSGFQQFLLKKIMNCDYENFEKYLPAHSVVAWWDESSKLPYTEMTALDYGWSFNVSLRSRSGRGYIYDSNYISSDQAIDEINKTFNKNIEPIAKMTWKPHVTFTPWTQNVIGIGLSTGFLEPLGSPGHTLIGLQLKLLSEYWSPCNNNPIAINKFNKKYQNFLLDTLDFICCHYLTNRQSSSFWIKEKLIPDTLFEKLETWNSGIFVDENFPVYSLENYAAVLQGNKTLDFSNIEKKLLYKNPQMLKNAKNEYQKLLQECSYISVPCLTVNEWMKFYD